MNLQVTETQILSHTIIFVKEVLANAEGGHDWYHIQRVHTNAKLLIRRSTVDLDTLVVELGALLHDIADAKFYDGDETIGPKLAGAFLRQQQLPEAQLQHVVKIIEHVSFGGGNEKANFRSPELDVVQDADRLDALGAIGIARTFNYGGFKNRKIYDPVIPPNLNMTKKEYRNSEHPTINHFYEKLLQLKDKMNTKAGHDLALQRHHFMEKFLEQFYKEWNGEDLFE